MTVAELIEKLSEHPPDTEVERWSDYYESGTSIDDVTFEPEKAATVSSLGRRFGVTPAVVIIR